MSLIPMNVEQMRRKALENSKAKLQQQKDFKNQVDTMSRHDVGNLYDVRAIMKSKQFKEQKICAQPKHSIATECFRYTNQTWSGASFPLILMDVDNQISYYSETAGFWPIGFSFDQNRPLEEIRY